MDTGLHMDPAAMELPPPPPPGSPPSSADEDAGVRVNTSDLPPPPPPRPRPRPQTPSVSEAASTAPASEADSAADAEDTDVGGGEAAVSMSSVHSDLPPGLPRSFSLPAPSSPREEGRPGTASSTVTAAAAAAAATGGASAPLSSSPLVAPSPAPAAAAPALAPGAGASSVPRSPPPMLSRLAAAGASPPLTTYTFSQNAQSSPGSDAAPLASAHPPLHRSNSTSTPSSLLPTAAATLPAHGSDKLARLLGLATSSSSSSSGPGLPVGPVPLHGSQTLPSSPFSRTRGATAAFAPPPPPTAADMPSPPPSGPDADPFPSPRTSASSLTASPLLTPARGSLLGASTAVPVPAGRRPSFPTINLPSIGLAPGASPPGPSSHLLAGSGLSLRASHSMSSPATGTTSLEDLFSPDSATPFTPLPASATAGAGIAAPGHPSGLFPAPSRHGHGHGRGQSGTSLPFGPSGSPGTSLPAGLPLTHFGSFSVPASSSSSSSSSTSSSPAMSPASPGLPTSVALPVSLDSAAAAQQRRPCALARCRALASSRSALGYCLRHASLAIAPEPAPRNSKQWAALLELLSTEQTYSAVLEKLVTGYLDRLEAHRAVGAPILGEAEVRSLFHNIRDIAALSRDLVADLKEVLGLRSERAALEHVPLVLASYVPSFHIYRSYLQNYEAAVAMVAELRAKHPRFDELCAVNAAIHGGLGLDALLVTPVQRLPRYLLLVREMARHTETELARLAAALGAGAGPLTDAAMAAEASALASDSGGSGSGGSGNTSSPSHSQNSTTTPSTTTPSTATTAGVDTPPGGSGDAGAGGAAGPGECNTPSCGSRPRTSDADLSLSLSLPASASSLGVLGVGGAGLTLSTSGLLSTGGSGVGVGVGVGGGGGGIGSGGLGNGERGGAGVGAGALTPAEWLMVNTAALENMRFAQDAVERVTSAINTRLTQQEQENKVRQFQARIEKDARWVDLVAPSRWIVREGTLKKRYSSGSHQLRQSAEYYFVLFNDLLLYATEKGSSFSAKRTYKIKHVLPLRGMSVLIPPLAADQTPTGKEDREFVVRTAAATAGGEARELIVRCATTEERAAWVHDLHQAVCAVDETSLTQHLVREQQLGSSKLASML